MPLKVYVPQDQQLLHLICTKYGKIHKKNSAHIKGYNITDNSLLHRHLHHTAIIFSALNFQ